MCINPRQFRRQFRSRDLGPLLMSLKMKRAQAEYHLRRIVALRSDSTALFHGQDTIGEQELLAGINAEINAAMHILRTMLDILAHIVKTEKGLSLGRRFYFHTVKDDPALAGTATHSKMDQLNSATVYLRNFDNYTKHNRAVRSSAVENYDVAGGRTAHRYPVQGFLNHPPEPDAIDLVRRVYDEVIDGIADVLDTL